MQNTSDIRMKLTQSEKKNLNLFYFIFVWSVLHQTIKVKMDSKQDFKKKMNHLEPQ